MKNWFDLKYSLRVLRKTPGHTSMCIAIVALSLCIGLIALTLVYNLMYKPLNFNNADRWVHLTRTAGAGGISQNGDSIDSFHYQYIKDNNTVFEKLGAVRAFSESRMNYGESATRVASAEITPHIIEATGLQAFLGRLLQASDSARDYQVAVISYSLWQNYFSSDPDIVGKIVNFDEAPLTIVGVMPQDTMFGAKHDVWIATQSWLVDRPDAPNIRFITPVGVLKAGVSRSEAQTQLSELTQQLKSQYPDAYPNEFGVLVSPFRQFTMEDATPIFLSVAFFSCIIVLLGAVNIGNLLISRTIERRQEFAIRNCVGSSPFDGIRQSLQESFLICFFAMLVALPFTLLGMKGINFYIGSMGNFQGREMPANYYLHLDTTALVVALVVLASIWLICGFSPALKLRKLKTMELLSGNKGTTDQKSLRSTKALVGVQIIAAFFLLIVSGSLLIAILGIVNTDYGLSVKNRYVVHIEMPGRYDSADKRENALKSVANLLRDNPAINAATAVAGLPHTTRTVPFAIGDRDVGSNGVYPNLRLAVYSPEAFDILGVDIIDGRPFDFTDTGGSNSVMVVDRNFAETVWPNESPLGKQVQIPAGSGNWLRVIGVSEAIVPGMRYADYNRENMVYIPISRLFTNEQQVIVETAQAEPLAKVFSWVRDAVGNTDSGIAVYKPHTLSEHLIGPTYGLQLIANIFVAFGIVAVILAIIGVFAVISRSVLQQIRNIGIRRAIGSSNHKVLWLYFRQGLTYLLVGALVGGGAALVMNNTLANLLTELPRTTPFVALCVAIAFGAMVTIASLAPAQKALKFEPGEALHQI